MKTHLLAALLALAPGHAFAWSNQGHMATGAIAYDTLSARDPAAVAAIVAIMERHPDRARFDAALKGLSGDARTRVMFQYMARWPDDIRPTPYSRPDWHYHARIVSGGTAFTFKVGDADKAFAGSLQVLRDPKATPAAKAIALCWLFHITGDMQQPLHAGHRISWRFPFTDRLGTIAWVKRSAAEPPVEFHQLWDHALDRPGDERAGAEAIAASLRRVAMRADQEAVGGTPGDLIRWFTESSSLARDLAYAPETLAATRDPAAAPVMPASYITRMQSVSRFRVAQGGRRLANLMAGAL
jgi:S1/P1 Nuclease